MSVSAPQVRDVRLMGGNGTSPGCWAILFPPHGGRQPKGKSFLLLFVNTSARVLSLAAPALLRAGRASPGEKKILVRANPGLRGTNLCDSRQRNSSPETPAT